MALAEADRCEWIALSERDPGSLAVAIGDRTHTVAELKTAARSLARELIDEGVAPGDRVVLGLPSSMQFVALHLAIRLCGAVLVNVPWQWRRELVHVVDEVQARLVVLPDSTLGDEALNGLEARRFRPRGDRVRALPNTPVARAADDVAWLAYTSGTTGAPKGAVHTEATFRRIPEGFIERFAIGGDDTVLVAAPVGHAVGLIYGVVLALRAGCPLVLMPRWDALAAAELITRHRCTFVAGPTPFLVDTVELLESGAIGSLDGLRFFCCGGAAVPTSLLERAREALAGTHVSAYYGTSECGGVTACPPDAPTEKVLTTDGLPLPGMELAIEQGELLVRGPQMARGYWGPDRDGRFRADGWCATGDEATIDRDGYLRVAGRRDDTIRRGGVNVSPVEIEEVLASHPRVREVAIVGVGDDRLGQRVAAAVVSRGAPPSVQELRDWCEKAGLAKVKWPELVRPMASLTRSPTGKVLRTAVRSELSQR